MENSTKDKTITFNVTFLKWYFTEDIYEHIHIDDKKEKVFAILSNAVYEDPMVFMRIILYIANTRNNGAQDLAYKTILHFCGILVPQFLLNNLDLILKFGYKNDILMLLSTPNISNRVIKFIEHKSKKDDDFKTLLNGKLIDCKRKKLVYYKPKLGKKYTNSFKLLLEKILDDPTFNGILT